MRWGLRASFVLSRMAHSRLLLGAVLAATLITATLTTALASFSARTLPEAARHQVVTAPNLSITISGAFGRGQATADTARIAASVQGAFGTRAVRLDSALWSNPLGLPPGTDSGSKRSATIRLTEAAALDHLTANAVLTAGTWPGRPRPAAQDTAAQDTAARGTGARGPAARGSASRDTAARGTGAPIPAALPAAVAGPLRLAPGDVLVTTDRITGARDRFLITGLYRPRNPAAAYWGLNLIGTSGVSIRGNFVTYGPLLVNPAALGPGGLPVGQASWVALPDPGRIAAGSLPTLAARISRTEQTLSQNASLGGLSVTTGIPALLTGIATSVLVARSIMIISVLELLLLAGAALALAARLLAGQREEESALLSARGLTRLQQARLAAAEGVLLAAAATAAGAVIGLILAGLLADTGPLRAASLHAAGVPPGSGAAVPTVVWWTCCAILVLAAAIILWPSLNPPAPGTARSRKGRQARLAGIARAGGDAAVIALAVIAVWQLRFYSAVPKTASGGLGIDPVLAVAPALALAGAALVPVRLIPALARAADALTARSRRLGGALASWQISRRPIRQTGPVLLVILAVATGTLALAQHQSWRQSALDQAAFTAGADVRVDLAGPQPLGQAGDLASLPGVRRALPVTTFTGSSGTVLALDARRAGDVALLRPDLSPLPIPELWRRITPSGSGPGITLPGRTARLAVTARLARGAPAQTMSLTIQDANGISYVVPAGRLPGDGRSHILVARLAPADPAGGRSIGGQRAEQSSGHHPGTAPASAYPLRLLAITVSYQMPGFPAPPYRSHVAKEAAARAEAAAGSRTATVAISALAVAQGTAGTFAAPFASGAALRPWTAGASSQDVPSNPLASGIPPRKLSWQDSGEGSQVLTFRPGTGHLITQTGQPPLPVSGTLALTASGPVHTPLPAIATNSYLTSTHTAVGTVQLMPVSGTAMPIKIVAAVQNFPTVGGRYGGLIVDLASTEARLAADSAAPLPVTQWWLQTAGGAVPRGLPAGAGVTSTARLSTALLGNPVSAAPQQAVVAIAVAAALLAALGFSASVAASVHERRTRSALLAALGVSRSGQAGQLCLEQLMLSAPAAAAGLLLGAGIARLLVPAVTITATAARPLPPALVQIPLAWAALLAVAVTAVPVLAAALTVIRRPDPAAELRAAEAG